MPGGTWLILGAGKGLESVADKSKFARHKLSFPRFTKDWYMRSHDLTLAFSYALFGGEQS